MKTKENAGKFFEIGDLVQCTRDTFCLDGVVQSTEQNRETYQISQTGIFWKYEPYRIVLPANSLVLIIDLIPHFRKENDHLFICLGSNGKPVPLLDNKITLIQKTNGELPL